MYRRHVASGDLDVTPAARTKTGTSEMWPGTSGGEGREGRGGREGGKRKGGKVGEGRGKEGKGGGERREEERKGGERRGGEGRERVTCRGSSCSEQTAPGGGKVNTSLWYEQGIIYSALF